MSSSQAYLGAFESEEKITVTLNHEVMEEVISSYYMEETTLTAIQWKKIWKGIFESDLVSDFVGGAIEIANQVIEDTIEGKK